ncbi:MAG: GntR family transcriptional regulator [Alphaproteobacteria bacterium]|nr:GntR family transcriptional regulator [Alphaproteobacteria bacterium]
MYSAILDEILDGRLPTGAHLIQEQLATDLGVSRQPVQQAMALLKADGLVEEIGTRGLKVAALDFGRMNNHYDIRAVLDAYAARASAQRVRDQQINRAAVEERLGRILQAGRDAVRAASFSDQIRQDEAFHKCLYAYSGNAVLAESAEPHWRFLRRVMADVLRHAEPPPEIWDQHTEIAEAIVAGDPDLAQSLAQSHIDTAARKLSRSAQDHAQAHMGEKVAS